MDILLLFPGMSFRTSSKTSLLKDIVLTAFQIDQDRYVLFRSNVYTRWNIDVFKTVISKKYLADLFDCDANQIYYCTYNETGNQWTRWKHLI